MSDVRGLVWLADASGWMVVLLKATAVLAAARSLAAVLSRSNPRWRVLAWRAALFGLIASVLLAMVPPLMTWRVAAPTPPPTTSPAVPAPAAHPHLLLRELKPYFPTPTPVNGPSTLAKDSFDPRSWLPAAWGLGVALGLLRFLAGAARVSRTVARAVDASDSVRDACRATAGRLGVPRPVRVMVAGVCSPCLTGLLRPTILLPTGLELDADGADLDAVLLHELTHVRNGDLYWNDALHIASIVLWFHPLAWRMRSAHASACDAVCDAVAVDQLGDVETYGGALARLALQAGAKSPTRGLAMARECEVRRRVAALRRMVHRSPLPRKLVMLAMLFPAAIVVLVGGTAVIRAHDDPPKAMANSVEPGDAHSATVAVPGRTVVGRVVVEGKADVPVNFKSNTPVTVIRQAGLLNILSPRIFAHRGDLDENGRFRVDDVPPGRYMLSAQVDAHAGAARPNRGEVLGHTSTTIIVPEGPVDSPVDVGSVVVDIGDLLKVGDMAPPLDLERVDGPKGRFVLAEQRGKVVVLDFWGTWCLPRLADMPGIKEIQQEFGDDPRFELVGVSCDRRPEVAGSYAERRGFGWTQAFAGPTGSDVLQAYGVRGLPPTFLIGPDGRILARNVRGGDLKTAISKALDAAGEAATE